MQNVVTLLAPLTQARDVKAGETVGYDAEWTAKRDSRLATLSLGYADGILRSGWQKGERRMQALAGRVRCLRLRVGALAVQLRQHLLQRAGAAGRRDQRVRGRPPRVLGGGLGGAPCGRAPLVALL